VTGGPTRTLNASPVTGSRYVHELPSRKGKKSLPSRQQLSPIAIVIVLKKFT
jgi:hypothetical protein